MKRHLLFGAFLIMQIAVFSQNHKPTAVDDYYETFHGEVLFNPLSNDYDIDGDSISIHFLSNVFLFKHGYFSVDEHGNRLYKSYYDYTGGLDSCFYIIRDHPNSTALKDTGLIVIKVDKNLSMAFVEASNVKAAVNSDGFMFCEHQFSNEANNNYYPRIEYPKGSGISPYYCANLWIGGLDENDSLHLAAQRYQYQGKDYSPGPVSLVYDSMYDVKYKRLWLISKSDIDYHINHWSEPHYTPAQILLDWPGNGDVSRGESEVIAPFYDNDLDGIYNPYNGDYPLIRGDQAVLFVFNDDRYAHEESGGKKLGIEIIGMLYAFDCHQDSALWNSIFLHFDIANRSPYTYHNTYFGTFFDNSLGYEKDDYLGCDVQRGSFYCYNGENYDITGSMLMTGYGYHPPAEAVTVLGGPYMPHDGLDNASGNCDEGTNGLNFGNGITDDERIGLSISGFFTGMGVFDAMAAPGIAEDYYNFLRGHWKDSTQFTYWGNGHPAAGGSGPICRYMFPGNSDPCHYGTWGIDPGGTEIWTEEQAGNQPYHKRSFGSSGPVTFYPGDIQPLDIALVFGRDFTDTNAKAAIPVMQQRIDSVRSYFIKDITPCGQKMSAYNPALKDESFLYLYPNPTQNSIVLEMIPGNYTDYYIFDMLGNQITSGSLLEIRNQTIDFSAYRNGIYFLKVANKKSVVVKKIVKI